MYNAYNKGVPVYIVARAFSCTEDDVYEAIVLHAVSVDKAALKGFKGKDFLKEMIQGGFPIEQIAAYYEISPERLRASLFEEHSVIYCVKERLIYEYRALLPRPTVTSLAIRHKVSYHKALKWISEYKNSLEDKAVS
jgi:uncharacterized protein (DUF433 family)